MTTPTHVSVLADVNGRLVELGDGRDCKSDREKAAHAAAFGALDRRRMAIRDTVPALATLAQQIAAVEQWTAHLRTWKQEFIDTLAALPADARERSADLDLRRAVHCIDFGCSRYANGAAVIARPLREKICAAYTPSWDGPRDPWTVGHGGLDDAAVRLASLVKERDALQSQLDAALREPAPVTA